MKSVYRNMIIGLLVLGVIFGALTLGIRQVRSKKDSVAERTNQDCLTKERVFDEADLLTDEEEEKLRVLIARKEKEVGADIVLVLLRDSSAAEDWQLRDYAQDFYGSHGFGWNQEKGDGILYADNWAKDSNGYRNCWLCTAGNAVERLDEAGIDRVINKTNKIVNDNPYKAYRIMVETAAQELKSSGHFSFHAGNEWLLMIASAAAVIFAVVQLTGNKGRNTTSKATYVHEDSVKMRREEDYFLHSHVTRRKIEEDHDSGGGSIGGTDGYGGGGGHH